MRIPVLPALIHPFGGATPTDKGNASLFATLRGNLQRAFLIPVAALSFVFMTAVLVALGSMAAPYSSGCLTNAVMFRPGTSIGAIMSVSGKRSCALSVKASGGTIDALSIETLPAQGRVTAQGRRRVVYEPPRDFAGRDSFTLAISGKLKAEHGTMQVHVAVVR